MKELYQKRVSDVRFLIPVLNGLDKQEILAVLPKLITQSPNVVKEVFNRLLGSYQRKSKIDHCSLSFAAVIVFSVRYDVSRVKTS